MARRNSIWKFLSGEYRKSREALAIESMNPLRLLTAKEAEMIFDCARRGNYARIQSIYAEIERTDPTLMVCVQRRAAALLELDWKVVRSDERLDRGDWGSLADDQIAFLETAMAKCGNLPETIEHLALAAFRGYSHARPVYGAGMRSVEEFDLLDSWNFCWDRVNRQWLWNPDGTSYAEPAPGARLKAVPRDELATVRYASAIDWPALMIFLRTYVGERDWGRFLERYGIPPVTITSPEGTNEEEAQKFAEAAQAVFNGQSGSLPFGSVVTFASAERGMDPFSQFLDHQQRLVVLMATGGLLTSLAESGSGTLAGNAHMDTWRTIVRRDSRMISNAIQRVACEPMLRAAFPGKPILATWRLETEPDAVPAEVFDLAAKAKSAGLLLDPGEVSEQTGYTVTREESPQLPMAGFGFNSAPVTNSAPVEPSARERVRAAIQGDIGPVADRVRELLAIEDPGEAREAAAKLAADIPGLMPDDPELADALEREIAEAFAEGARDGVTVENVQDANGAEHAEAGSGNGGQFVKKGEGVSGSGSKASGEHTAASPEVISRFQSELPEKISPEDFDSLLTAGFTDTDGAGNAVRYGSLLRDHWDDGEHSAKDIKKRKERLGIAGRRVRGAKPVATGNPQRPDERIYVGNHNGKAYIAIADEHNEISAIEMVSYRRDRTRDE